MSSTSSHVLPFEKPVVELVARVRELRELARSDRALEPELRRLEDKATKLARELFAELTPWQKVQLSRHPNRPYTLDYIARIFDGLRRAARRPHLRRRRGDRRGPCPAARALGRRRRPPEGPRRQGEGEAQLRDAAPRGLPEGAAPLRAGEPLRPAHPHAHRHARRLPGHRRRGARAERGHRRLPGGHVARAGAHRRHDHRRRRERRRARARRGQPGPRARVRHLQRHLRPRAARRSSGRTRPRPTRPPRA